MTDNNVPIPVIRGCPCASFHRASIETKEPFVLKIMLVHFATKAPQQELHLLVKFVPFIVANKPIELLVY